MQRRGQREWAGVLAAGVLAITGGCQDPDQTGTRAPSSTVDPMSVVQAARTAQSGEPGSTIGQGGGDSMQPIYGNNTVMVIEPIEWGQLKPGMNVAYFDPFGDRIVHQLLYMKDGVWVAKGLNNMWPDKYAVTPKNLIGVVYGSFQTDVPDQPAAQP
jgi:hypothetical protein